MSEDYINECLKGKLLHGDDFNIDQINKWFSEEKEGYSNLDSEELKELSNNVYHYHNLNLLYGFSFLKDKNLFSKVLGIGAAGGHEFEPIKNKIKELHILEPSDNLRTNKISGVDINYKTPTISGKMDYQDNYFNLITSFGVLHHIPNVSFVISEIYRVLDFGGYFLVREPIISMGDWRNKRDGLTKNERGIPKHIFKEIIEKNNFEIVSESYCFTLTTFFNKTVGRFLKHPIFYYRSYLLFDKFLSKLFENNVTYFTKNKFNKLYPQNVYFVLKKKQIG
ncbi:methyltransferase domain-containing protein [Confluentibacter lentus]|uniref:methyltransferase domain-containing protein n=1 Tax=Confluentibacter lentus TaxID=1699412 RepID=UPI000C288A19|nr:methyltransferase domain-containing protein [Confluentibacter lentus]